MMVFNGTKNSKTILNKNNLKPINFNDLKP